MATVRTTAHQINPGYVPDRAVIKIQSVQHYLVERPRDGGSAMTIGQHVDKLMQETIERGSYPNKLTLDLNPREENPGSMEE